MKYVRGQVKKVYGSEIQCQLHFCSLLAEKTGEPDNGCEKLKLSCNHHMTCRARTNKTHIVS